MSVAPWRAHWYGLRREIFRRQFRPRPRLTLSEWADRYARLPPEVGPEPGPWRTARVPYLREIMDSISDRSVETVVLMKGSQIGFTMGAVVMTIGYFIHQNPAPILVFQPTEGDAKKFSRKKLSPVIQETPELRDRVAPPKSRDSANTTLQKEFDGGSLGIGSAGSPRALRQESALVVLLDEVDGYDESAGDEGDPVKLAEKRTGAYWRPVKVLGSTPTVKGLSRIEKAYLGSDQRRYHVPCPHCEELQVLRWGDPESAYGFKWGKTDEGEPDFDSVAYLCKHCGALIEERHKLSMISSGRWLPDNPGGTVRGYHLPQFYSPFPGARWPNLVRDWYEAQEDAELLQVFVNHVLAETWEERGTRPSSAGLQERAEAYVDALGEPVDVPDGVGVLTAAVDVHDDRLELQVDGWGAGEERWLIGLWRIYSDPDKAATWALLEAYLGREWRCASGARLRIAAVMIDSGHKTDAVYGFVSSRESRKVYACKGDNGKKGNPPLSRPSRSNAGEVLLWTVGTFALKSRLFARLGVKHPGPGYMHFCEPNEQGTPDANYFAQFEAEKKVRRKKKGSRTFTEEWVQVKDRNEAIDLSVYSMAALISLGDPVRESLGELADQVRNAKAVVRRPRSRVRSKGVRA